MRAARTGPPITTLSTSAKKKTVFARLPFPYIHSETPLPQTYATIEASSHRKEVFSVEEFFKFLWSPLLAPVLAGMILALFQRWLNHR